MLILTDPKKMFHWCLLPNFKFVDVKTAFFAAKKHKQDEPNIIQALETRHPKDLATKHENEAGVGMNFLEI